MERTPLVSVIVPNYNHGRYLEKRFSSILRQTFDDFEIIILDDNSTDNSKEIINQFRDEAKVSQVVFNEVNSGSTFEQWNKGIALARGRFIWIAESDDWCEPTFLEELVAPLLSDDDVVISFCQSLYVTPQGEIIDKTFSDSLSKVVDGKQFVIEHMLGSNAIGNASMVVFRKKALAGISNEYRKMKYCGDWYFWVNLSMLGKTAVSGKYLNYYFRHQANVSTGSTQQGLDFIEGNEVYHFIVRSMPVPDVNKLRALDIKAGMFRIAQAYFKDASVEERVRESLYTIDPRMKSLMWKKYAKMNLRGTATKVLKRFL